MSRCDCDSGPSLGWFLVVFLTFLIAGVFDARDRCFAVAIAGEVDPTVCTSIGIVDLVVGQEEERR